VIYETTFQNAPIKSRQLTTQERNARLQDSPTVRPFGEFGLTRTNTAEERLRTGWKEWLTDKLQFAEFGTLNVSVTGYTGKARSTVACLECKRQKSLSLHFGNFAHLLLLSRNLEIVADGDTSITYRLEVRPIGTKSATAFGKWVIEPTSDTILAGMRSAFGKDSEDR
jgi:hypothetical protein